MVAQASFALKVEKKYGYEKTKQKALMTKGILVENAGVKMNKK